MSTSWRAATGTWPQRLPREPGQLLQRHVDGCAGTAQPTMCASGRCSVPEPPPFQCQWRRSTACCRPPLQQAAQPSAWSCGVRVPEFGFGQGSSQVGWLLLPPGSAMHIRAAELSSVSRPAQPCAACNPTDTPQLSPVPLPFMAWRSAAACTLKHNPATPKCALTCTSDPPGPHS